MMTKESINRSYETTFKEGVGFERRLFHAMFATNDRKKGMKVFVEKKSSSIAGFKGTLVQAGL
jgi:enoyl-CoA hydratase/carnithine racemase